jgi:excisionase family DNA binding protein
MDEDMVNDNQMGNMLTVREASRLLHIHPNTLKRWSDKEIIRAYRITPRGDRRFKRQDITHFLAELNAHKGDERKVSSVGK